MSQPESAVETANRSLWTYTTDVNRGDVALIDYDVNGPDGELGKVVEETAEVDESWIVVDTGFWITGKKRLVPAGLIEAIDHEAKTVRVAATKDQIKESPDYEKGLGSEHRAAEGDSYKRIYSGWLRM